MKNTTNDFRSIFFSAYGYRQREPLWKRVWKCLDTVFFSWTMPSRFSIVCNKSLLIRSIWNDINWEWIEVCHNVFCDVIDINPSRQKLIRIGKILTLREPGVIWKSWYQCFKVWCMTCRKQTHTNYTYACFISSKPQTHFKFTVSTGEAKSCE